MNKKQPPIFHLVRCIKERGTFGVLYGDGFHCDTMERPWKDNVPFMSCIPTGRYLVSRDYTGKHHYFSIKGVAGRTEIEIHPANHPEELAGCIALGEHTGKVDGRLTLLESMAAVSRFVNHIEDLNTETFVLWIKE